MEFENASVVLCLFTNANTAPKTFFVLVCRITIAVGGAVFFAVCRGKVSEGLDFADDNGLSSLSVQASSRPILQSLAALTRARGRGRACVGAKLPHL